MPPKKLNVDSDGSDYEDPADPKLQILQAKRETLFSVVQKIYDLSSDAHKDTARRESFLDEASEIDSFRDEYKIMLDEYNSRLLEVDTTAKPDYSSLAALESLYSKIKRVQKKYSQDSEPGSADVGAPNKARPTLPRLELVAFDGDVRSWPLFYASFKQTVHENSSLTDSDKLYYLLGKLTGKAKTICAGISPCAENYELILKALIDKYEDKRMLAYAYLNQLFEFRPIQTASAGNFDLFTEKFISAVLALKNLKIDNLSDLILIHIALKKLDAESVREFELSCTAEMPAFDDLVSFVRTRSKIIERTQTGSSLFSTKPVVKPTRKSNNATALPPKYQSYISTTVDNNTGNYKCLCSNVAHQHLYKCADFNKMTPQERFKCVKDNNACVNCLGFKHRVSNCSSNSSCRVCKQKHHTLLHFPTETAPATTTPLAPAAPQTHPPLPAPAQTPAALQPDVALCTTGALDINSSSLSALCNNDCALDRNGKLNSTILLSTAQVAVYDANGDKHIIRALLDSASQSHFLTRACCDILGITLRETERTVIKGFGGAEKFIKNGSVELKIHSRFDDNINFDITPLVVDQITDLLPSAVIDTSVLSHLSDLPLADETFGTPNKIDALIGASLFPHLLLPDVVHSRDSSAPTALRTVLGYVIMGSVPTVPTLQTHQALTTCCLAQEPVAIDSLVRRFWELEELPSAPPVQRPVDAECEIFYKSTTTRDPVTGRYVVGLPFNGDIYSLGNSYETARRRFMCLERKLEASPMLRSAYDDVIKDYLDKEYISPAPPRDSQDSTPIYVIPHHGVVREDKTSTRLRIVLDASCKTTAEAGPGPSLNDILHSGPNLQGDLFTIILNFRLHAVAMTSDCRQQFLQILMRPDDRRYQCFLYRFSPQDPLVLYQFNRVCFGLSSSPYHALRTVRQLIEDDGAKYPLASSIAPSSLFMDDLAFSLPSEQEAIAASQQLIELFKGAQWDLVKWNSNSRSVLNNIPDSHKLPTEVEFDKTMHHKILGLHWSTEEDTFFFKVTPSAEMKCTKRSILSTVARLWDIMGFIAPTVMYAKLLIKQLWQLNLDWDETPPPHIIKMWKQFCDELPALNDLRIPRHVGMSDGCDVTLLGFSDASSHAYGAVVYLRVSTAAGSSVQLVCAKSKVAPTKPLTIARLELCGAVLLSKLLRKVHEEYSRGSPIRTFAFVDSMVVLYWINSSPHRWQTFVANRVVQVTDNIPAENFYHVAGVENPADIISRGITPQNLISHPLWLHGPQWASLDPSQWPLRSLDASQPIENIPEGKVLSHTVCTPVKHCALYELALRISSWSKLLRVIVYTSRFARLLPRRSTNAVTAEDLNFAENKILSALQSRYFAEEYSSILNNKPCSPAFNRLRPFIADGLILVGGRLDSSALEYSEKHPVVLPRSDHVVDMIIDYYHVTNLHAGPELLMSLLRRKYWILSARRAVRRRVHSCNTCFRQKPRPTYPLMADLPDSRTRQVIKAFTHTGCDYAGPIAYTPMRRRGVHREKAYFCVFTCLTTRAVHIEVATDLSTPSFLAALKRFLARRGPVQFMYSDNGTNFKGADSYLRDLYTFLNDEYHPKLEQEYAESRITWKFICPNAPHHGGAWESMVKVIKGLFFRTLGHQLLSYEELCTVLAQIECVLNSRPLTVLSSDPAEPSALTPSHFLHTAPLLSLPAPEVAKSDSLVHRHALLDKLVQSFWDRWRMEYLHGLQVRQKWNTPSSPIAPGTVVVVMSDNVPPLAWPLAIVDRVHPSKDGIARVATVRTVKGTYLRPVVRLCPLPTQ